MFAVFEGVAWRRPAAVAAGVLAFSALPVTASAQTLMWRDATRVAVLCLVARTPLLDNRALESELCRRVVEQAARGAPLPVAEIAIGDPQVISADTVTLLVHASVQTGHDSQPVMAMALRPFRATSEQTAQLFGAAPRAAALDSNGSAGADLDSAIAATLDETLPWRAKAPSTVGEPLTSNHIGGN